MPRTTANKSQTDMKKPVPPKPRIADQSLSNVISAEPDKTRLLRGQENTTGNARIHPNAAGVRADREILKSAANTTVCSKAEETPTPRCHSKTKGCSDRPTASARSRIDEQHRAASVVPSNHSTKTELQNGTPIQICKPPSRSSADNDNKTASARSKNDQRQSVSIVPIPSCPSSHPESKMDSKAVPGRPSPSRTANNGFSDLFRRLEDAKVRKEGNYNKNIKQVKIVMDALKSKLKEVQPRLNWDFLNNGSYYDKTKVCLF